MDHSENRFGERNWSSQQEQEQHFQNFMRQNDPNRQDDPLLSTQDSRMRNLRASETLSRTDMSSSSFPNMSASRRRNTYDPSVMRMPPSTMQIPAMPTRRSPRAGPKEPPIIGLDVDIDNLSISEASELESTDQKPAAVQMQQVPGGIDIPAIGGPFASMVRDNRDSTVGGSATSFPRTNEDRWHSGGAPTKSISPRADAHGGLPPQISVPPRRRNYPPLEPSVPETRLGRRCLIHKPKREADLVKGLVNAGATGSIRSRDTVVVTCAKCGAELSVSRNAIAVSCPSCYKISPVASCAVVDTPGDHFVSGHH